VSTFFDVRIEWLEAPGVVTPELAATWARYELWVGDRCVTQVETADGTFRRSVYGSLYPLAQWVASNWWLLTSHIRPSAVDGRYWTWPNLRSYPWLAQHNLRGAGDGMAWPDLTVVAEGAVSRIVWTPEHRRRLAPVRFASGGDRMIPTEEMRSGLAEVVDRVLERLAEEGLPKTQLAEEWATIAKADDEERAFCRTVARMGLDPYSVSDQLADDVISVAAALPGEVIDDFFDSADVSALAGAAEWTRRAMSIADRAAAKAKWPLGPLYEAVSASKKNFIDKGDMERPWMLGYAMARALRRGLDVRSTEQFDPSPWVAAGDVSSPSNGIQGYVTIRNRRCGLVLGSQRLGVSVARFGRARALGPMALR
jgi:hypothetical protein